VSSNKPADFKFLFGTPLWTEFPFDDVTEYNQQLYSETMPYKNGNLFDMPGSAIKRLKDYTTGRIKEIAYDFQWENPNFYLHGRQNPIPPYGVDTPHFHLGSKMLALYYLKIPPNSGDLLLHDTRGWNNWPDLQTVTEEHKTARAYHRIKPIEGMFVMHPSYVTHSVEPNLSDDYRISLALTVFYP
jgi:hypothetical protein